MSKLRGRKACGVCLRRFKTSILLEQHVQRAHPSKIGKKIKKKVKFVLPSSDQKRKENITTTLQKRYNYQKAIAALKLKELEEEEKTEAQLEVANAGNGAQASFSSTQTPSVAHKYLFRCPVCEEKVFENFVVAYRHIQEEHCFDKSGVPCPKDSPKMIQPIKLIHCSVCNAKISKDEIHKCLMVNRQTLGNVYYCCNLCNACYIGLDMFIKHTKIVHDNLIEEKVLGNWLQLSDWKKQNYVEEDLQPYRVEGDLKFYMICRHEVIGDGVTKRCPAYVSFYRVPEMEKIRVEYLFRHEGHHSRRLESPSDQPLLKMQVQKKPPSRAKKSLEIMKTKKLTAVKSKPEPTIVVQPVGPRAPPRSHYEVRLVLKEILDKTSNLDSDQLEVIYDAAVNFKRQVQIILDNGIGKTSKTTHLKTTFETNHLKTILMGVNNPEGNGRKRRQLSKDGSPDTSNTSISTLTANSPKSEQVEELPKIVETFSLRKDLERDDTDDVNSEKRKVADDSETSKTKCQTDVDDVSQTDIDLSKSQRQFKADLSECPSFNDNYKNFIKNFIGKGQDDAPNPTLVVQGNNSTRRNLAHKVKLPKIEHNLEEDPLKLDYKIGNEVVNVEHVDSKMEQENVSTKQVELYSEKQDKKYSTRPQQKYNKKQLTAKIECNTKTKEIKKYQNIKKVQAKYVKKHYEKYSDKKERSSPVSVDEFKNILKVDKYEVKERENDCNILILKL